MRAPWWKMSSFPLNHAEKEYKDKGQRLRTKPGIPGTPEVCVSESVGASFATYAQETSGMT